MLTLELPMPPSVNHYWHQRGHSRFLSKRAKVFREHVGLLVRVQRRATLTGPLHLELDIHPPDRRRHDLDNCCKAMLDALQHAEVYEDDHQISRLLIQRCECVPGGKAVVRVKEAS